MGAPVAAQNITTTFFPLKESPSEGQPQLGKQVMPPMATDQYLVAWERTGPTTKKRLYSAVVLDRSTKKEVYRGTIPLDPEESKVEDVITMGEDVCIIYRVHDNKEYHVTLYALRLSLPNLQPVGESIKLGFYDFPNNGNPFIADYWFTIMPSADGSKWGILLSKRFKDKKEQEFACWMKDAALTPLWEHVYRIPTEAERMEPRSMQVTDAGEVLLVYSPSKNAGNVQTGSWLESDLRWPSSIGKVNASGATQKPIDIGSGNILAMPGMVATKDGFLIGGVVYDRDSKGKVSKVATMTMGADLELRTGPDMVTVTGLEPEKVSSVELSNNGTVTWMFVKSEAQLFCIVGEGASVKKVGGKLPFADVSGTLTLTNAISEPVAVFFDLPKNIQSMRAGEEVRAGGYYLMEPAIIQWSADGKANVKQASKDQDGTRDVLKQTPTIGYLWKQKGIQLDQLTGKDPGLLLVELK